LKANTILRWEWKEAEPVQEKLLFANITSSKSVRIPYTEGESTALGNRPCSERFAIRNRPHPNVLAVLIIEVGQRYFAPPDAAWAEN
jgi:hypothetical protein